ncbi:MAG: hypothetical protein JWN30_2075 [Bacilli bacterium]|nr:hypothetical protein [Bacilli bacterium]
MNPFSKQNPLDSLLQIRQMGEQLRTMFGDDFMSKFLSGSPQGFPVHPVNPYFTGNNGGESSGNTNPGNASDQSTWDWNALSSGNLWPAFSQFGAGASVFPKVDLYQSSAEISVVVEMPGLVNPKDITIIAEARQLEISGQIISAYQAIRRDQFTLAERNHGTFERTVPLPVPVRTRGVVAFYAQGLIEINLPKATGGVKPGIRREIPIQIAKR